MLSSSSGSNFAIVTLAVSHGDEVARYYYSEQFLVALGLEFTGDAPLPGPLMNVGPPMIRAQMTSSATTVRGWVRLLKKRGGGWVSHRCFRGWARCADEDVSVGFDEIRPARWFVSWGSEAEIFEAYVEQLRSRRRSPGQAPRVWCSWYSYYENVSWDVLAGQLPGACKNLVSPARRSMMAGS